MRTQAIAALLLLAVSQTACTTSFDVMLQDVPSLQSGMVTTIEGKAESVTHRYLIKPHLLDGYVLLRPRRTKNPFQLYPKPIRVPLPVGVGWRQPEIFEELKELKGPITMTWDGQLAVLKGANGTAALAPWSVKWITVEQLSPAKTAVLVTGMSLVTATFVLFIAALASISGPFVTPN